MTRSVWIATRGGRRFGIRPTRLAAQRIFEKPYMPGGATVFNSKTGEKWQRNGGSWIKVTEAYAGRASA